ncbi:hypothetical protein [Agromyces sp. Soil535]|uniref:hypothetical protein n=1 Tax=Agromyces sp. Soil535 TaxID=1736390 RepID=UPI0006F498B9|nr:hypothetical protein [Agromyces sp. Soil535]KRE21024.1 hypothetical protein ASG80_15275 [Agromyces sp. Soil535]
MGDTHYAAHVDRTKTGSIRRWNAGMLIVSLALGVLLAGGLVVTIVVGMGWFTIVIASLGVIACAVSAVLAVRRRRALALLVADDDIALTVGATGVRLAGAPLIPWEQIVFVGVVDDRERTGQLQRLPLSGALARATVRAGSPTLLCELGVRDGVRLRHAFVGARGAAVVTLFDEFDGARRGLVPLMLDAVVDDATAHQAAQVLIRESERRGIPARSFRKVFEYFEWKGPMIDRKWPVEKGSRA